MSALDAANPDIIVVDLSLDGIDGLELIQDLRAARPKLPALVLSAHDESRYAQRAIHAGARGYVAKSREAGSFLEGIRQVLAGKIYLSQEMMQILLAWIASKDSTSDLEPHDLLSNRELEVFNLIGHGLRTAEIARKNAGQAPSNLRLSENEQLMILTEYRWIDQEKGIVRVPIDRAIELVLADEAKKEEDR